MSRIGIVGQGAWGTALGSTLAGTGAEVLFWRRGDDPSALLGAEIILVAVPAQATRTVLAALSFAPGVPLVLTAKGLEQGTLLRQSQVAVQAAAGHPLAVLSGPSFAADLTRGLPTAITLATGAGGEDLQARLSTPSLRLYLSDDVLGAELGGALKNVIAIACGAAIGSGLGESARAAVMARGFAEMVRIGLALGAQAETLAGLSGLGDLALTCTSQQSRNFQYGVSLGETGEPPAKGTYEGAASARAAAAMARRVGVDAPVIETVAAIVEAELTVQEAVARLMARPLRRE